MSLDALYNWLGFSTLLVIAGVILEGQEIWSEIKEGGCRNIRHIWAKIGLVLLIVGLCLELFFQTKIESADAELKRKSDIEIAQLGKEAEEFRAKNLDMEAAVSPRVLEQGLTSSALRPFAGTPFLVVSPTDFEPKRTAGQIRAMLSMARWKKYTASIGLRVFPFFNGVVVHSLGDSTKGSAPANALVAILNENKIAARTGYTLPILNAENLPDMEAMMRRDFISLIIEVGPKPLPESMQLKPGDIPADTTGMRIWGNIEE